MVRSMPAWVKVLCIGLAVVACTLVTPAALEAQAGTLRVAVPYELASLDPHGPNAIDLATTTASKHLYDTLVARTSEGVEPSLAKSWDNPDPYTWHFYLREDVRFHDGSPLTAQDVKASFERIRRLGGPAAPLFEPVESVEAVTAHEVVFRTSEPLGTLLINLTRLFVLPAGRMDDPGFFNRPVGSGPFQAVSFSPGNILVLKRNPDYWGGAPGVERLELVNIPEVASRMVALQTGEIDVTWLIPSDQLPTLRKDKGIIVESLPSWTSYVIWFNSSRKPFDDVRVRRAVWHAIDWDKIIANLYQGIGQQAQGPLSPGVFGSSVQTPYTYDPQLARQLLAEAGYPNGFRSTVQWKNDEYSDLVYAMISDLKKVGIELQPMQKEHAIWLNDLLSLNWDINVQTVAVTTGDADYSLGRLYLSSAKRTGYANAELDDLLLRARRSLDQAERAKLYEQAARIIWEEAVGMFPIDCIEHYAYRQRVKGFVPDPGLTPSFASVTLEN